MKTKTIHFHPSTRLVMAYRIASRAGLRLRVVRSGGKIELVASK